MKRPRTLLSVCLRPTTLMTAGALVAGVAAALAADQYVRDKADRVEKSLQSRFQPAQIVVASRDIGAGEVLDNNTLAIRAVPRDFIPPDAVPPSSASRLIGARAVIDLRRGTAVVPAAVKADRTIRGLAAALDAGERGLTVQVDQNNSIGGHLNAGDRVDVYYSRRERDAAVLVPLLEDIHVLATGEAVEGTDQTRNSGTTGDFTTVTLLVTADQAARIVLAEQTGRLTMVLRPALDHAPSQIGLRNSRQLLQRAGSGDPRGLRRRGIELITGGHGDVEPGRTWLAPGTESAGLVGDAS